MNVSVILAAALVVSSIGTVGLLLWLMHKRHTMRPGGVIALLWLVNVILFNGGVLDCLLDSTCSLGRVALNVWASTASLHGVLSLAIYVIAFESGVVTRVRERLARRGRRGR